MQNGKYEENSKSEFTFDNHQVRMLKIMSADILWDVVGLKTATDIISCHISSTIIGSQQRQEAVGIQLTKTEKNRMFDKDGAEAKG